MWSRSSSRAGGRHPPLGSPLPGGESAYYLSINRNKRSVTVNLKDPAGKEIARRLARRADVVVENFSPGTAARLGLGYDNLRAIKPDLVYCSISGFGQDGPGHRRPAYDLVVQGMSGMMSLTGEADGPPTKMGVPIADMTTGMFAAFAIASALLHRERTGEGQYIDTSMLGSQVALLVYYAVGYFATGEVPQRQGNRHQTVVPYDTFTTADGYVNLPIGNEALWARFCAAFDLPEAAADPRFASNALRMAHREPLYAVIEGALSRHTTAEVMARLDAAGVPAGPIATVDQVFAEPQTLHLGLKQPLPHPTIPDLHVPGFPYRLSATPRPRARRRRCSASTPTRFSPNSATTPGRSRGCAKRGRSRDRAGRVARDPRNQVPPRRAPGIAGRSLRQPDERSPVQLRAGTTRTGAGGPRPPPLRRHLRRRGTRRPPPAARRAEGDRHRPDRRSAARRHPRGRPAALDAIGDALAALLADAVRQARRQLPD